jgi:hypothetical protein
MMTMKPAKYLFMLHIWFDQVLLQNSWPNLERQNSEKLKCWKKYIETINLEIPNVEQGLAYDGVVGCRWVWAVWIEVVGRCWWAGVSVCAGDHYDNHTHTVKPSQPRPHPPHMDTWQLSTVANANRTNTIRDISWWKRMVSNGWITHEIRAIR